MSTLVRPKVVLEMETSDPDDFLTLLWLSDHPRLDLRGVVLTPGTEDQCQLVAWALDRASRRDVAVGAFLQPEDPDFFKKKAVSEFHYKVYERTTGEVRNYKIGRPFHGWSLMNETLGPDVTVITGAPPKNLYEAFQRSPDLKLGRWVMQGGFAGDSLVASEHRLAKFTGKETQPSFNPGGCPRGVLNMLQNTNIARRLLVSKNVCHGVTWTRTTHDALMNRLLPGAGTAHGALFSSLRASEFEHRTRPGLKLMIHGLDRYLVDKGVGKAMHDIVAATCALDESVCTFTEVEVYRQKGEWGARAKDGTHTFISVAHNHEKFLDALAAGS